MIAFASQFEPRPSLLIHDDSQLGKEIQALADAIQKCLSDDFLSSKSCLVLTCHKCGTVFTGEEPWKCPKCGK